MRKVTLLPFFTRLAIIVCLVTSISACKKKNDEPKPEETAVVHGKVYGKDFTMAAGRARTDAYNNNERLTVNLSANSNFNCSSAEVRTYSVYFRVPKKVGVYTAASEVIWLGFDDSTSDQTVGFVSADCVVDITSISNGRVAGKISFADQPTDSSVSGTFDVPICQ
jgi:hypothetical protein